MTTAAAVLSGEARWCVLHGDCLDVLDTMPADSFDSSCADVPYELGFMGRTWDRSGLAFNPETYRKVLRVLKPGAHLLVFGGTRTYHRIACAIEDAGFEIRDSISVFSWVYGSGFPKSLNVSLAMDKVDGIEDLREVVHRYTAGGNAGTPTSEKGGTYGVGVENSDPIGLAVTRGASDKSRAWDGWGTALKPAWEPVIVARKPLVGTVVENVLQHGTGAINIDACRVATNWDEPDRPDSWKRSGHTDKPEAEKIAAPAGQGIECHPGGRWPPNVLFVHHPSCRRIADRVVKRELLQHTGDLDPVVAYGKGLHGSKAVGDVPETVAAYDCHADCPVRELERQSGVTTKRPTPAHSNDGCMYHASKVIAGTQLNDTVTAARFFPQFEIDDETLFLYCAKAARAERELGCERIPPKTGAEATGSKEGQARLNSPRTGAGRSADRVRNSHPTVKPTELIRYLLRMVTRKDGVNLDFTCGSGTGGVAAVLEEMRFVGIELNDTEKEPFVTIARARIDYYARAGVQRGLFEAVSGG